MSPVADLPLDQIFLEERFRKDYGDLDELTDSIKQFELIQTIAVKDMGDDASPRYRLIAGGRRFEACKRAGLVHAPCRIYPPETPLVKIVEMELVENLVRKGLEWEEEAANLLAIDTLKKTTSTGWTSADTGRMLNRSEGLISQDLELGRMMNDTTIAPLLKVAKTKTEAKQILNRLKEGAINEELVRRVKKATPIVPVFDNYIVADFFKVAPELERESVDCIEMDPPWAVAYNDVMDRMDEIDGGNRQGVERFTDWTVEQYETQLALLADIAYRLLRNDRWLLLWGGILHYERTSRILTTAGFKVVVPPALWVKPGLAPVAPSKGWSGLVSSYELLFYAAKGTPRISNIRSNVFIETAQTPDRFHPTEKPKDLMKAILSTFMLPAQQLLVPFAGSGNSLAAAHELNIHSSGYDLSTSYQAAYAARMIRKAMTGKDGTPPTPLLPKDQPTNGDQG